MNDSKMIAFRTAVGGYNKKDVNDFIATSEQRALDAETALKAQLEASQKENSELREKLSRLEKENEQLVAEKSSRDDMLSEKSTSLDALAVELEDIKISLDVLKAELDEKNAELEALRAKEGVNAENAKKAELYDNMSTQLGEMIISAKKASQEMLENAELDAQRMREETGAEIEEIRGATEKKASEALGSIYTLLHNMAEDTLGEMMTYASEAQFTIGAMFEEMKRKSSEINDRISYINSSSSAKVRDKILEIEATGKKLLNGSGEDKK